MFDLIIQRVIEVVGINAQSHSVAAFCHMITVLLIITDLMIISFVNQ